MISESPAGQRKKQLLIINDRVVETSNYRNLDMVFTGVDDTQAGYTEVFPTSSS